jgi:hypothetical protein
VRGVRRAVRQELRESAYRFVALVHALERNHGRLNRELLQWVQTHASRYQGPNPSSGTLEATTALLALSDEEIATMGAAVAKGEPTNLPPEELLYTRAAVQDLHVFPELQVARVLDVLAQVRMYNETAAEWKEKSAAHLRARSFYSESLNCAGEGSQQRRAGCQAWTQHHPKDCRS